MSSLSATTGTPPAFLAAQEGFRWGMQGLYTRGARRLDAAVVDLTDQPGAETFRAQAIALRGLLARGQCDWSVAERRLEEASRLLATGGARDLSSLCLALGVEAMTAQGRLDDASAAIQDFTNRVPSSGLTDLALAVLQTARGDFNEASTLLQTTRAKLTEGLTVSWCELFVSELLLDRGKLEEAHQRLGTLLQTLETSQHFDECYVRARALYVRALVELEWTGPSAQIGEVSRATRDAVAYAVNFPRYRAWAQCSQAQLRDLDSKQGQPLLDEALATLETLGARLDLGRALARQATFRYGRMLQPTRPLIARSRDLLTRAGASARAELLARLQSGDGGNEAEGLGRSMMGRSMMGQSIMMATLPGDEDVELQAILHVTQAISSTLEPEQLFQRILDEVVKLLKCERGALLRRHPDGSIQCVAARGLDRERIVEGGAEISFTILRAVERSGEAVLTDNAQLDERFRGQASVMATEIRSLMCAPLKTPKGILGFLYVDSTVKARIFQQSHKELLAIFAGQSAISLENALTFAAVDDLNRNLESKVSLRTRELQGANEALAHSLDELQNTKVRLLETEKRAFDNEMSVARKVQESIVPSRALIERPGFAFVGRMQSAIQVGGDFWTYLKLPGDRTIVLIGDVTGHGVAAGMLTTTAKACCDTLLRRNAQLELEVLMGTLSDVIHDSARGALTMTAFGILVEPEQRTLRYCSAAHNPPLYLEHADGLPKLGALLQPGSRLGDELGNSFETKTRRYAPGDRVLLFTDGLLECTDAANEEYGLRRLRRSFVAHAALPLEQHLHSVVSEAETFWSGVPLNDDFTALLLELH